MPETYLSQPQINEYNQNGYIILRNFCSSSETEKLLYTAKDQHATLNTRGDNNNPSFQKLNPSMWFSPEDNVMGYWARSEKVVHTISALLKSHSPVCHVQTKVSEKKPNLGGVWEWHQDYGYWSQNNFLKASEMVMVMVALTPMDKENGGSQLIKGSHTYGKIKHHFDGERNGADLFKVNKALETLELVYPQLAAGDAIFFHSNLLHRADANLSAHSRWSIISCYSAQSNLAKNAPFTSWHTPVSILPNEAILQGDNEIFSFMC